jgi:hypothetical protein
MKLFRRRDERGFVIPALAVTLLCVVLGGGAATAAIFAVLSLQGPNDSSAVTHGHQDLVDPGSVIPYGG